MRTEKDYRRGIEKKNKRTDLIQIRKKKMGEGNRRGRVNIEY
jgi:hypothetical protein